MGWWKLLSGLALTAVLTPSLGAQVDARMFRQPDVSATHVAFVYAGDIWVVPKTGGLASRLSSPAGEEQYPRFSPDGTRIAFSANYDGNTDVYVVPALGGEPRRLTHHPAPDRVLDWYPDGSGLLYASSMAAGRQRFNQLFRISDSGGLPTQLPVPYGEYGSLSPDGRTLAFSFKERDSRTWKRYRGGWAPDIWLFDLVEHSAENISQTDANDAHPMWHGRTLYFLSDRGAEQRYNIWAYDLDEGSFRQVTGFSDFDISGPAIGPQDIVFQAGGRLYLLDLETEETREVAVEVVSDLATLKPRVENVGRRIQSAWISPTGKRAVFEARGEIFTVPAEHGVIRNLTTSSGVAERYPTWSPDGEHVAYWSDRSGEYELTVRSVDRPGEERTLTSLGPGYRYAPYWSPDSRKMAFLDQEIRVRVYDMDQGTVTEVDQSPIWSNHGQLESTVLSWSPDSRWLAYARPDDALRAIFLYDTRDGRLHQVTSGYYSDSQPVFDPDGNYLFFLSNRSHSPVYGDTDNSWVYPNTTQVVAVSLRDDVPSPLAPRNDEEGQDDTDEEGDKEAGAEGERDREGASPAPVEIDLAGFETRLVILPPEAGNYTGLSAASGKVIYRRLPRSGSGEDESPVIFYDLKEREEKTVLEDADEFHVSADGKKMLVRSDRSFAIVDVAAGQKMEKRLATEDLETVVDPKAEWRQLFADAWRLQRDFFYDRGMHGLDWEAMRDRYGALLEGAVTRWDVNFVIGELIGELNASHTYRGGGDLEQEPSRPVGLLGVDWALEDGAYRIARVLRGAEWDAEVRSPLDMPGVEAGEGDYVLAVNGVPLDPSKDPWAAFEGLAERTVSLTVNDRPTFEGAREVFVETLRSESRLRHLAWIEANRKRVEEATGGRVGYVYVRSTGIDGQNELVRQFMPQFRKDALIIDERFNSGGQIPDRFIELLNRPALAYWAVRDGSDWRWPPVGHFGPKVMLINGWSGSGGDAFPFYFREAGLGPLVGSRTWGGLIGISGAPSLVDGGFMSVPTFRMYDVRGNWFAEGRGVDPDIEVPEDPGVLASGVDPQLERAIQEATRLLEESPFVQPERPAYEDRTVGAPARGH